MTPLYTKSTFYSLFSNRNGLPYKITLNYNKYVTKRPPLEVHQQFADLLGRERQIPAKKAGKYMDGIRSMLDDIVQNEHLTMADMTPDEFHGLYYHPTKYPPNPAADPVKAMITLHGLMVLTGVLDDGYDPRYKRIAKFISQRYEMAVQS